jgi:UDP-N-acetylmuramate--alanine ligase
MLSKEKMKDINTYKKIHIVGIGGIGVSALAQLLAGNGAKITGSDRDPSPKVHEMLGAKGIKITVGHSAKNVPSDAELLIYSDAVVEGSEGYVEREAATEHNIPSLSYFEALGAVSKNTFTIAVAGTHGKTTTTGMLGKLLIDAKKDPTVIVGSIIKDFNGNFVGGDPDLFVVEACEYKDHVLKLHPNILVLTNLEWDHTDWFESLQAVQKMFQKAIDLVQENGIIVTNPNDPNIASTLKGVTKRIIDYTAEFVPALGLIGEFNIANAKAAKAAAKAFAPDIDETVLDRSLEAFQGSWRRFEYMGMTDAGATVFDDYAHHPTAIIKTLEAAREKFPEKNIIVAFHPHLYTRTRDLMDEFATALMAADRIFLAPIYPAREEPIPGVTSFALAEKIKMMNGDAEAGGSFDEIETALRETCGKNDLIITMGAGDIYKVAERLVKKH